MGSFNIILILVPLSVRVSGQCAFSFIKLKFVLHSIKICFAVVVLSSGMGTIRAFVAKIDSFIVAAFCICCILIFNDDLELLFPFSCFVSDDMWCCMRMFYIFLKL